jgi:hypothetical protein
MNKLSPDKERIVYAEWSAVRNEIEKIRSERSKAEGREITEAEFLRCLTLKRVNKYRAKRGKKKLTLDPTSSPGGPARFTGSRTTSIWTLDTASPPMRFRRF